MIAHINRLWVWAQASRFKVRGSTRTHSDDPDSTGPQANGFAAKEHKERKGKRTSQLFAIFAISCGYYFLCGVVAVAIQEFCRDQAIAMEREAIAILSGEQKNDSDLRKQFAARLRLYEAHEKVREPAQR